jgi:hypothetical protein
MADYRDPKTTPPATRSGTSIWLGVILAVLVVLALIWWWRGGVDEGAVVEPSAPVTQGTTEQPAPAAPTTEPTTPTPPAQQ